jgi:type 1 fimbria pilin
MRSNAIRILGLAAGLVGSLWLTTSAHAACGAVATHARFDITTSTLPSFTIPVDRYSGAGSIGSTIGTWNGQFNNNAATTNQGVFKSTCASPGSTWAEPILTPIPGVTANIGGVTYPVYASGAPGIGYAVTVKDPNTSPRPLVPNPTVPLWSSPNWPINGAVGLDGAVVFVVTAPLRPGNYSIPSQDIGYMYYSISTTSDTRSASVPFGFIGTSLTVTGTNCTVTSGANQVVPLPAVAKSAFGGVGSTAGTQQSFNMGVNCPAGVALYATMTDANSPTNTGNALTLQSVPNSATGVGIRLFSSDSTPISFGPDSSVAGNTNQWLVGGSPTADATNYTVPFKAQYVQTETNIRPGTVNAVATITFSYQ